MSGASWSGSVRLPQCWPGRVRSAAVQAVSLADLPAPGERNSKPCRKGRPNFGGLLHPPGTG